MAAQGRVGDEAHGATGAGPATSGASATFVNGQPAMRAGDAGTNAAGGTWQATSGSPGVFIEGQPAHRQGDDTVHSGNGALAQGSPNVDVGDYGGNASAPRPHDLALEVDVVDATDRKIKGAHIKVQCPHPPNVGGSRPQTPGQAANAITDFDETTRVDALCTAAPITIYKSLERGKWDAGAKSGAALPASVNAAADHSVRYIHAPAPEADVALTLAKDAERQITIPRADSPKAVIRLTTAYNWMELVYQAFGFTMPTGANQVALLGVREGVLNGGQRRTRDDGFDTSTDRSVLGLQPGGHQTKYDDLLFLAVAPTDVTKVQRVEALECSIDPGNVENDVGMPLLLEGKLYHCRPHSKKTSNDSLEIYSVASPRLQLTRIKYTAATRASGAVSNHRTFETLDDAHVGSSPADQYKFYRDEAQNGSVLIHWSWAMDYVDAPRAMWSTGCTVMHHGRNDERYTTFLSTALAAANRTQITHLIVSTRYVKSYAEWAREVDLHPETKPTVGSVIRRDGLESPTGVTGRYLPSIVSKGFADAVNTKATDLANPRTAAMVRGVPNATISQNLTTSLDAVMFTVVD